MKITMTIAAAATITVMFKATFAKVRRRFSADLANEKARYGYRSYEFEHKVAFRV